MTLCLDAQETKREGSFNLVNFASCWYASLAALTFASPSLRNPQMMTWDLRDCAVFVHMCLLQLHFTTSGAWVVHGSIDRLVQSLELLAHENRILQVFQGGLPGHGFFPDQ